jgi:hypothetical protein
MIIILGACIVFKCAKRKLEEAAAQLFSDAEKAERGKKEPQASDLYRKLLANYSHTDYVSKKMKSIIKERIQKSETLRNANPNRKNDWLNGEV